MTDKKMFVKQFDFSIEKKEIRNWGGVWTSLFYRRWTQCQEK